MSGVDDPADDRDHPAGAETGSEADTDHDTVETVEVPAYYAAEIQAREQIADACPFKVFTSSSFDRWGWPWKLNNSGDARPSVAESCREMLIDPGLWNLSDTAELAHAAHKLDADYVIAKDISPEHPRHGNLQDRHLRSVETALNYLAVHSEVTAREDARLGTWDLSHDATVLFPIQAPFGEALDYMAESHERQIYDPEVDDTVPREVCPLEDVDHFAVGGLASLDVDERIRALHTVRDRVGEDAFVHALSPGTDIEMLAELRENTHLIDSLDVSTPENAPGSGKLPDKTWTQHKHLMPTGDDSTTVRTQYAGAVAIQLAFMLTPDLCDDELFDDRAHYRVLDDDQSSLDNW